MAELIANYLPRLAEAYSSGDVAALEGIAADKERARLSKVIRDLELQEGRVLEPKLVNFDIESTTVWNYSNAYVKTIEVWDFRIVLPGDRRLLSEVKEQRNRVLYQLKRTDAQTWMVLDRNLQTTFEE